ncbi:50S ribosomal protein L27 [Caballeronia mineralivorans]|uniref:50S ribosomal protein L27 n=1 Tax=Caballeronia mineralivorans TaxID=2010198 RepID=UPI00389922DA
MHEVALQTANARRLGFMVESGRANRLTEMILRQTDTIWCPARQVGVSRAGFEI